MIERERRRVTKQEEKRRETKALQRVARKKNRKRGRREEERPRSLLHWNFEPSVLFVCFLTTRKSSKAILGGSIEDKSNKIL